MPVDSVPPSQRFCLFHPAQGGSLRGCVVYIHPFAEEMNKSRRMAALQARLLAAAGFAVLQIDLHGCGDSSGDFGDATWQDWVDDAVRACGWLRAQSAAHAQVPLWLWGLRVGCLIATAAAAQLDDVACNFLFWQPTATGKTALQQFLRLKLAADMLSGSGKGAMDALRERLAAGQAVEIGGYTLHPALATGLEQAKLLPHRQPAQVVWLELSTAAEPKLTPVAVQAMAPWTAAAHTVNAAALNGPAFWQTAEIEDAPALLSRGMAAMTTQSTV